MTTLVTLRFQSQVRVREGMKITLMFINFVKLGQCERINLTWSRGTNDTG